MTKSALFIALLATLFMMNGCSPKATADLYGKYQANYDLAKENLTLNPDGTFVQEVILKSNGKADTTRGLWDYENGIVTFRGNFMNVRNEEGTLNSGYAQPSDGLVGLPAESYFGTMYLGVDKDVLYKKM